MNNCGCEWEIIPINAKAGDYDCYWRRNKDDSCQTCIEREKQWSPLLIRGGVLVNPFVKEYLDTGLRQALKHLAGQHDQKRHAWRYGSNVSLSKLRQQKRESLDYDWREYKRRARAKTEGKVGYDGYAKFNPALTTATARADSDGKISVNPKKWDELTPTGKRHVMAHEIAHNSIENYISHNMREWNKAEEVLTYEIGKPGTRAEGRRLFVGGHARINEAFVDTIAVYLTGDRFGGLSDARHNEIMRWAEGVISRAGYDPAKLRADVDKLIDQLERSKTVKHLAGQHDQKRHAWRYGSNIPLSRLKRQRAASSEEEWNEYKDRARARRGGLNQGEEVRGHPDLRE